MTFQRALEGITQGDFNHLQRRIQRFTKGHVPEVAGKGNLRLRLILSVSVEPLDSESGLDFLKKARVHPCVWVKIRGSLLCAPRVPFSRPSRRCQGPGFLFVWILERIAESFEVVADGGFEFRGLGEVGVPFGDEARRDSEAEDFFFSACSAPPREPALR